MGEVTGPQARALSLTLSVDLCPNSVVVVQPMHPHGKKQSRERAAPAAAVGAASSERQGCIMRGAVGRQLMADGRLTGGAWSW